MGVSDDAFRSFAKQVEQEELERSNKKTSGGFEYETVKWVGIPDKGVKIIRGLGEAPDSGVTPFTSRTIQYSKIKADDGKEIRVILPRGMDAQDHIIWKIIRRVMDVEWVKKEKIFVNKVRHPDIYEMVAKNSLPAGTDQYKFDKGWTGREMFIMNCIDRDPVSYAWSKENKHTVLLSKRINMSKDIKGDLREYAETGIPAYGFTNVLALNIFKYYYDWNEYDIAIEKTAINTSPYKITHASKHIEEIPEEARPLIVEGPLSAEELSWARYDLDKLFGVTSYTKLFNRLGKSIAKIDLSLGTTFAEELRSLAEMEKKEKVEPSKEEQEAVEIQKAVGSIPVEEKTTVSVGVPVENTKTIPARVTRTSTQVMPHGYQFLSEEEKALITKMENVEGNTWNITYNTTTPIAVCTDCKTPSPETFATCPGCGSTF